MARDARPAGGRKPALPELQAFIEAAADGVIIIDGEGRILAWNRTEERITGISREDAIGRYMWEIQHRLAPPERRSPTHDDERKRKILAGLAEGLALSRSLEDEIQRADGERRIVVSALFAMETSSGVVACGISRDTTDRVRAEQDERNALRASADSAGRARRALAEASRRKDDFLALLSHELRNPIATMRNSLLVMAARDPVDPTERRMLVILRRQLAHLTRLTDDLLDLTRLSHGRLRLRRERLDLVELVRAMVDDVEPTFTELRINLAVDLPSSAIWLNADPTRVAQVVNNLLNNAAKFTPGGCRVDVSVRRDGGQAELHVRDTGLGIAVDELPSLFQPFVQSESTLHRSRGGLGLGLALVKALVEMHGGSAVARSDGPGTGAEFVVRLPANPRTRARSPASRSRDLRSPRRQGRRREGPAPALVQAIAGARPRT